MALQLRVELVALSLWRSLNKRCTAALTLSGLSCVSSTTLQCILDFIGTRGGPWRLTSFVHQIREVFLLLPPSSFKEIEWACRRRKKSLNYSLNSRTLQPCNLARPCARYNSLEICPVHFKFVNYLPHPTAQARAGHTAGPRSRSRKQCLNLSSVS